MHGRKEFKSDFPFLKNEYANQLKDNRAVKKCRKKRFSHYFNFNTDNFYTN